MNVLVWTPPDDAAPENAAIDPTAGRDVIAELAALDVHGRHHLCHDVAEADIVLFTVKQPRHRDEVAASELYAAAGDRALVYDRTFRPVPAYRGAYTSLTAAQFDPRHHVAVHYLESSLPWTPPVKPRDPDLLFSFVGRGENHVCRWPLYGLDHPRGFVEDTTGFTYWTMYDRDFLRRKARFWQVLIRSKFVLSPRGVGPATLRPLEALVAGRVPVVIADAWVPSGSADWDAFSLQWPEDDPEGLVAHLEAREADWEDLRDAGEAAWATWFRPEVAFHHFVEDLTRLLQ